MDAVLGSILENLRGIEIVEKPTAEVFKKDRLNTGDSKEMTVREFVERYLPSDFRTKRGIIYSQTDESSSIDCVVLAPNHPMLTTPVREVILAEGVYAAIEVKPDISVLTDKGELMRGLKQIKSVKLLEREIEELDLSQLLNTPKKPKYYQKIPSIIFSHKSTNIKDTIFFIISKIKDGTLNSEQIPDLIVTLDKGIIFYTPHLSFTGIGQRFSDEMKATCGERLFFHYETPKKEITLALFLLHFLNLTPPTMLTHKFIINDYLKKMELKFTTNPYPLEINLEKTIELHLKNLQRGEENGN